MWQIANARLSGRQNISEVLPRYKRNTHFLFLFDLQHANSFGQICPVSVRCPDSVRISCPVSVCPDSVCLDSVRCQDSVRILRKISVRCLSVRILSVSVLSGVRILSGFSKKSLSVVCLSGRTRTRQSCPDFHCPCPPTSDNKGEILEFYEFTLYMIFTIFYGKTHYRNGQFQENRKHHINGECVEIQEFAGYDFCDFPSKMAKNPNFEFSRNLA